MIGNIYVNRCQSLWIIRWLDIRNGFGSHTWDCLKVWVFVPNPNDVVLMIYPRCTFECEISLGVYRESAKLLANTHTEHVKHAATRLCVADLNRAFSPGLLKYIKYTPSNRPPTHQPTAFDIHLGAVAVALVQIKHIEMHSLPTASLPKPPIKQCTLGTVGASHFLNRVARPPFNRSVHRFRFNYFVRRRCARSMWFTWSWMDFRLDPKWAHYIVAWGAMHNQCKHISNWITLKSSDGLRWMGFEIGMESLGIMSYVWYEGEIDVLHMNRYLSMCNALSEL